MEAHQQKKPLSLIPNNQVKTKSQLVLQIVLKTPREMSQEANQTKLLEVVQEDLLTNQIIHKAKCIHIKEAFSK